MNRKKTKVVEVLYGRMWFLAGMVVLMFCLSLFCSDARALYDISNSGDSYVYGLYGINARWATGPDFGTVSAEATYNDAYGLFNESGDVEIVGDFGPAGEIFATSGDQDAYGLYTYTGNIRTGALDGTIEATSGWYRAVGLFAEIGSIHTEDIGGTITVESWGSSAFGLRVDDSLSSIVTGDITGDITVTAGGDRAYGFRSDGSIHIGDITSTGSISATATGENTQNGDYAYGLRSNGTMTTGAINGTISAQAYDSYAFGLDSGADMTIDSIGYYANISATAYNADAIAIRSVDLLTIGDIDGTITAEVTNGNRASALRSMSDMIIGDIGYSANISATASGSRAAALLSSGSLTTGNIDGSISAEATYGSTAYGMYADSDITTGTIGYHDWYEYGDTQITATANGSNAYGLYAGNNLTVVGDIGYNYGYGYGDTQITATAGGSNAYGLYAGNDLTVGDIGYNYGYEYEYGYGDTQITASADGSNAYGMYAGNDLTVDDIGYNDWYGYEYGYGDTQITATAGGSNAYGLYAGNDLTVDDIGYNYGYGYGDTQITAIAYGSNAYGMYAGNDLTVGDIGYDATISATAYNDYAYGLYSDDGSIYIDNIYGDITALSAGDNAAGLYSSNGDIDIYGDIEGYISATAQGLGNDTAYGLYASGSIYVDEIYYGTISAEMTNGSGAYGMYAGTDITVDYMYGADITATAGTDNAYGLSSGGAIYIGEMDYATIEAEATGSGAYGMYAGTGITVDYYMDDSYITATAGTSEASGDNAYGMYAVTGDISVDDMYDSDIHATAWGDNAVGIYSEAGSVNIGMYGGEIHADADGDYAYGILSYGAMDVLIDGGTIIGEAGGTNVAAIQSGRIGAGLETQNADDTVEIVAGSTIVGNIDLANNGTDDDLLTLSGYNWDSTTFAEGMEINNVETINITGGTWHVNGSIINNTNGTTVSGGILEGTGTLENVFVTGGTLNPGNSIGTIYVANLTIGSEGTYEVEVDDSGDADMVDVSGTADLDGTIHGVALERISRDNPFSATVIDAPDDGLNDTAFADVTGSKLFLEFGVDYDYGAGDVILNVNPLSYGTYARTDNERSVGLALDNLVNTGQDTGDMDTVISFFDDLNPGEEAAANAALDQMMPQDALGLPEVTRNMMNQFSESTLDHAGSVRAGKQYAAMTGSRYLLASADNSVVAPPETDKWLPYAKGFGTWGSRNGEKDVVGYDFSNYGVIGGLDKFISDNTMLGFNLGGSSGTVDYDQAGTETDIDAMMFSVYGSYFQDDWHADLSFSYAHLWYDAQRSIRFDSIDTEAEADFEGDAYNIAAEFGNNFGGDSMLLEPVAGVGWTSVQQDSYTEEGADSLNLNVDSDTMDGLYSKLGLRWAKEFRSEENPDMVWVPRANAFWIHDFADGVEFDNEFIGGGSFTTQGLDPVADSLNVGAGLNVYLSKGTRLFVNYAWQGSSDYDASTLQAGAQWSF
jgi:uncharacterized protein with beta-barrel porin domain